MRFTRPTNAGWAVLAIPALCAFGLADAAFAQSAAPAAADAAPAAAPAAAAPVANKGDVAWMLTSSALVLMMSIPGLALFYGGLVCTKNMASVLTQVFAIVSMIGVTWTIYGYSMAFSDGGGMTSYVGGFTKAFMHGIDGSSTAATFSNGVVIPELAYFVFQMTFAMITPALIVGAFAERIKFSAVMLFILLWVTFIYFPIAHWVWYVAAPDDVAAAAKALGLDKLNAPRSDIPAVTHVDYSARVQTVHRETNPRFHALISAFKAKTGCPVLVNTSFNVRCEPIAHTPEDAFRCLMGTEIEMLVVGNCVLHKDRQNPALIRDYRNVFDPD